MKKRAGHYVRIFEYDKISTEDSDKLVKTLITRDVWCADRVVAEEFVKETKNRNEIISAEYVGSF